MTDDVESPCIAVCALDENDICVGCYRTVQEITDWWQMDTPAKRAVLDACRVRRAESGMVL